MPQYKPRALLDSVIDGVSRIFIPIINILSAVGIFNGLLALATFAGIVSATSSAYPVLHAMASSLFYFLPVFLAYTTAELVRAERYTAVLLAAVLVFPDLTNAMEGGRALSYFGLPVGSVHYPSSILPIILAVLLLAHVEKMLDALLPAVVRGPFKPLIALALVGGAVLVVLGPLGALISDGLAGGYGTVYLLSPIIAGAIIGAFIQPAVLFGFHWALIPIALNNLATTRHDTILAFFGPPIFAQAGAAIAVAIKTRNPEFRAVSLSAALSALFGVTEPAMYAVTLPLRKPLIAVCVAGGIGGAIVGYSGGSAISFAIPSIATLPVFIGDGFGVFLVGCVASAAIAFALSLMMQYPADFVDRKEPTTHA